MSAKVASEWVDVEQLPETKILPAYYDGVRKAFWTTNSRGGWIEVNEQSLRRLLRAQGFKGGKPLEGETLSDLERKLNEIQTQQDVAYAGPLAGHRSGITECYGQRILVTTSPTLIEPAEGDWPVLRRFLESLVWDSHYDQLSLIHAWLKVSYEALRARVWRPGPALALAGPRDCGKSLFQQLITLILGNRAAKPYRYMRGGSEFNAELFGAEHLCVEDEHCSTDIRSRKAFGSHIKQFTVNKMQSCHGKNRQALSLTPFWRVSISVNEEPEHLMVLPPLSDSDDDSLGDKMILLKARKADLSMPTGTNEEYDALWQTLVSEMPAFLHFLIGWQIPEDLRHGRFGFKTWQHPELLAALDALAPETRLLSLIDEIIFADQMIGAGKILGQTEAWGDTAEQLERRLLNSVFEHEVRKLLSWPTACGTYLSRLEHNRKNRVRSDRSSAKRGWIIYPPDPAGVALPRAA